MYDQDGNYLDEQGNWWDPYGYWLAYDSSYYNSGFDTSGLIPNSDGTFTDYNTGEIFNNNGDSVGYLPIPEGDNSGITDNNGVENWAGNTVLDNGDVVFPNGDVEHADGTWTFADDTNYDPGTNGAKNTIDQLLSKAGVSPIGGTTGRSTGAVSSGAAQSSSILQQAIAALAQLSKTSQNTQQLDAVRAAQARLGVAGGAASGVSSSTILLAGAALLGLYAFSQARS